MPRPERAASAPCPDRRAAIRPERPFLEMRMFSTTWPAIITLLTVLLQFWVGILVARARARYGVVAPATTGDPAFERTFRVQMNTIENVLMFLPAVWLAALYGPPGVVAVAGLVWLGGRVYYALAYIRDAEKRGPGFGIAVLGLAVLLIDAAVGLVRSLVAS
jgi:glutathione S-transferase